jgi:hypothetical protein
MLPVMIVSVHYEWILHRAAQNTNHYPATIGSDWSDYKPRLFIIQLKTEHFDPGYPSETKYMVTPIPTQMPLSSHVFLRGG